MAPAATAQDVHIATLRDDVDDLYDSHQKHSATITEILVALEGLKTRLAIWGTIITVATPLVSAGVAWLVLRNAGAQVVVPAQSAAPAALGSRAIAGMGEKP